MCSGVGLQGWWSGLRGNKTDREVDCMAWRGDSRDKHLRELMQQPNRSSNDYNTNNETLSRASWQKQP